MLFMRDKREFVSILKDIDGKSAGEYARLVGDFDFTRFVIHARRAPAIVDGCAQGLFVVHVPQMIAGFPATLITTPIRRTALEDYLARRISAAIDTRAARSGHGGASAIRIARPGPQILPRSSIVMARDFVEARLTIRLPLRDGAVSATDAEGIFFTDLPEIVNDSLIYCYQDDADLTRFVDRMEDADHIRQQLARRGLVSFLAEGSRFSSARPALDLPAEGLTTMDVPNARTVRGLGIPTGVTLIIGDPYSGRKELIAALAAGTYNHVVGDGREAIVSIPDIVRIDADPGRPVQRVDISPFLPTRPDWPTTEFTTARATPAESQMAGTIEAIQVGAQALVYDESFSDPAFLAADARLAGLRPDAPASFLSLSVRARQIANDLRVSLVVGAYAHAEEFFPVADTILLLENGRLTDVTRDARALNLAGSAPAGLTALPPAGERTRWIVTSSIDPSLGTEEASIEAIDTHHLAFGRYRIDMGAVSQLVDPGQTTAIGLLLYHAKLHFLDESRTVAEVTDLLDGDLASEGLDTLSRELRGDLSRPRRYEIAAALNRLASLRISRPPAA
jgi:predicted ABC-class ATPase